MANDRDELMRLADILRVNIEGPIGADEEEGDPGFICLGVDDAKLIENALRGLAQRAPQHGAVPEGWRDKLYRLSDVVGLIMDEVKESTAYGRLDELCFDLRTLAAAPAPEAEYPTEGHQVEVAIHPTIPNAIRVDIRSENFKFDRAFVRPEEHLQMVAERAKGDDGGDPHEFGAGIGPNPKARYWQERADFWRGQAVALGYVPGDPRDPLPAGQPDGVDWVTDEMPGEHLIDQVRMRAQFGRIEDDEIVAVLSIALRRLASAQRAKCWCETCRPQTVSDMRFIVCPDCGNKRCPKANDHRNTCTGSNEVGQPGSSWEHIKPRGAQRAGKDGA